MNVRAKGRAVNSVFLVQLRKLLSGNFRGLARVEKIFWGVREGAWRAWMRDHGKDLRGKAVPV